jgi:hypothetical protein
MPYTRLTLRRDLKVGPWQIFVPADLRRSPKPKAASLSVNP